MSPRAERHNQCHSKSRISGKPLPGKWCASADSRDIVLWDVESGTKKYRFVMYEKDGEWVFLGEVNKDGTVTSTTQPNVQPPSPNSGGETGGTIS